MLRFSRMTDYAIVVMIHIAEKHGQCVTAANLSEELNLPQPTVSKILKQLQSGDVLTSIRGANGGYTLARDASEIFSGDIITAIEGTPNIAGCVVEDNCQLSDSCPLSPSWRRLSLSLHKFLHSISLEILATNKAENLNFKFEIEQIKN